MVKDHNVETSLVFLGIVLSDARRKESAPNSGKRRSWRLRGLEAGKGQDPKAQKSPQGNRQGKKEPP